MAIDSSESFKPDEFDNWVEKATAPPLQPSLELYKELLDLGFKLVLLTGRSEKQRESTTRNLINAGFYDWDRLVLRYVFPHILVKLDDLVILSICLVLVLYSMRSLVMKSTFLLSVLSVHRPNDIKCGKGFPNHLSAVIIVEDVRKSITGWLSISFST